MTTPEGSLVASLVRDGSDLLILKDHNGQRVGEFLNASLADVACVALFVALIKPTMLSVYTSSRLLSSDSTSASFDDFQLYDFFGFRLALSGENCIEILQVGVPKDWNQLVSLRHMLLVGAVTPAVIRAEDYLILKAVCKLLFAESTKDEHIFLTAHILDLLLAVDPTGSFTGVQWVHLVVQSSVTWKSAVVKLLTTFSPDNITRSVSSSSNELSATLKILEAVLLFQFNSHVKSTADSLVPTLVYCLVRC